MRRDLSETRQRGYSISDLDYELDARGGAAPILGPQGGISVGGPIGRIPVKWVPELGKLLKEEAKVIF